MLLFEYQKRSSYHSTNCHVAIYGHEAIDHLHYDVKAQRLLVVVVKFARNFESSSSPLAQENVMEVKKNTFTEEDVPVASFKAQKATSQNKTKSVKILITEAFVIQFRIKISENK